MKNKLKAIIFDFNGTIVDTMKSDRLALNQIVEAIPEKIDSNLFVKKSIDRIIEFHKLVDIGIEMPLTMHRYRLEKTFSDLSCKYEELYLNTYLDTFYKNPCVYPDVENILKKLYGKVSLAILSNAYDSKEQNIRIDMTSLRKYFNDIVIAADINAYKPNPKAFLYFVPKYQLEPDSFLFIGDSEEHDILGAKQAGMHSIKINFDNNLNDTAADYCCNDYQSLSQLLDDHYEF